MSFSFFSPTRRPRSGQFMVIQVSWFILFCFSLPLVGTPRSSHFMLIQDFSLATACEWPLRSKQKSVSKLLTHCPDIIGIRPCPLHNVPYQILHSEDIMIFSFFTMSITPSLDQWQDFEWRSTEYIFDCSWVESYVPCSERRQISPSCGVFPRVVCKHLSYFVCRRSIICYWWPVVCLVML